MRIIPKRGGTKSDTLPDFFIGTHAAVERMTLITRDASRYRTYSQASCDLAQVNISCLI